MLAAIPETIPLVWTEWGMILVFIGGVLYAGWAFRKQAGVSLDSAYLADREVPGFVASLSTVATNLNINDFVGRAGFVYLLGMIAVHDMVTGALAMGFVALFVMRQLRGLNARTLGDWLERRYSTSVGVAYSLIWVFVWMLFNLGLYIFGGAFILNQLVGWDLYWSLVVLSVIAAGYTLMGGFRAVVATDLLQLVLMFFPMVILAITAIVHAGGFAAIAEALPEGKNNPWQWHTDSLGSLSVVLFGGLAMGMSYWSSEAQVVQRPLSARDSDSAIVSYLGAAFWYMILMPFVVTIPALAAISLFPDLGHHDEAIPTLIRHMLPSGLYGMVIIGMIAGFFSSADSQINAFCGMFTHEIYKRFLVPGRSNHHYVTVSRVAGVLFTLAAIGTAILVSTNTGGMVLFAISVLVTIMPPFGAVTILGCLWRRATSAGALAGLVVGGGWSIGLILFEQIVSRDPRYEALFATYTSMVGEQTFNFRALTTFLITLLVAVGGSLLLPGRGIVSQTAGVGLPRNVPAHILSMVAALFLGGMAIYVFWSLMF
ncbi:MAG: sodium/solute symporter [Phycisphaeraceae bacterium]